jgi:hypothetical protein
MSQEALSLAQVPSWREETEPDFDGLFSSSDRLTCLELWNFPVCISCTVKCCISTMSDP